MSQFLLTFSRDGARWAESTRALFTLELITTLFWLVTFPFFDLTSWNTFASGRLNPQRMRRFRERPATGFSPFVQSTGGAFGESSERHLKTVSGESRASFQKYDAKS